MSVRKDTYVVLYKRKLPPLAPGVDAEQASSRFFSELDQAAAALPAKYQRMVATHTIMRPNDKLAHATAELGLGEIENHAYSGSYWATFQVESPEEALEFWSDKSVLETLGDESPGGLIMIAQPKVRLDLPIPAAVDKPRVVSMLIMHSPPGLEVDKFTAHLEWFFDAVLAYGLTRKSRILKHTFLQPTESVPKDVFQSSSHPGPEMAVVLCEFSPEDLGALTREMEAEEMKEFWVENLYKPLPGMRTECFLVDVEPLNGNGVEFV
ncbi:hypothetical protein HMN09_00943600 [Mycena chlorophos]|uniref:EthD domain-containing protein n=1 Tax=Mycena chlorophos TaxID=658473 RepID=A0A8H6W2J1_MYCCL|nr:hypothetical protein HMN09_00943600 [Mycena chlorophos]